MELRPTSANTNPGAAPVLVAKYTQAAQTPPSAGVSAPAPVQSAAAVKRAEAPPSEEQVTDALESINTALKERSQALQFSVDKDSARTIVTVTDTNTKEVIRQMPTREAMEIAKALDRLQSLLTKQTA